MKTITSAVVTVTYVLAAYFALSGAAFCQGTQDYTGPPPRPQYTGPLPSNTTPPTVNRQRNIFSPGAATPPLRRAYRRRY